jgi:hypothetical protein
MDVLLPLLLRNLAGRTWRSARRLAFVCRPFHSFQAYVCDRVDRASRYAGHVVPSLPYLASVLRVETSQNTRRARSQS